MFVDDYLDGYGVSGEMDAPKGFRLVGLVGLCHGKRDGGLEVGIMKMNSY